MAAMRRVARGFGWLCAVLAAVLILLGLASLPSGGLMFALPYVFLMPGVLLAVVGAVLLRVGRDPPGQEERSRRDGL